MLYFIYELSPTTQSSLLERVQQGDEISWNEFYFRYAPVIRAAGIGFKFNETECDDLIQQVMLKFFNHALTKRRLGVKVLRRFMTIKKAGIFYDLGCCFHLVAGAGRGGAEEPERSDRQSPLWKHR